MNNKFKFKLKITGFEMEIEGSKEDVASISANIGSQLRGLVQPKGIGDDTEDIEDADVKFLPPTPPPQDAKKKNRPKKNKIVSNNKVDTTEPVIDIKVEADKYGTPKMDWSTCQKALWTIYVVNKISSKDELTITQITETFNKHFKQSKVIRGSNVSRDLGKQKIASPSLVGENTTNSPSTWYLTDEGIKSVQTLIQQQKNGTN